MSLRARYAARGAEVRELLSALVGQPPARGRPRDVRLELADGDNVDESDAPKPAERLADQVRRLAELGGDLVVRELLVLLQQHEDPSREVQVPHPVAQTPQVCHALRRRPRAPLKTMF